MHPVAAALLSAGILLVADIQIQGAATPSERGQGSTELAQTLPA